MSTHDQGGDPTISGTLIRREDGGLSPDRIKDLARTGQILNLGQQVSLYRQRDDRRTFLFTCSRGGEGVSTVVINLARLMIEKGEAENILLVDANGRHPVLHRFFQVPGSPGLSDASRGIINAAPAVYPALWKVDWGSKGDGPKGHLHVMPHGSRGDGNGMLVSHGIPGVLSKVEARYDYIFIDAPPVLVSADALVLARSVKIAFLVVEAYGTSWEAARKTKAALESQGCFIGGVILNRVRQVIPDWLYYRL